ncbi:MAG: hypothetical protein FE048_04200 [Thermoplasmata archaeon]|nr:MAG: hypothetical protein FE048_04200 [Thermoplasmata archaeon]
MDIEELQKKREEFREKIREAKEERERLNETTKELRKKRDEINAEIERYRKEGIRHREKRDEINKQVARAKKKRRELNKEYEILRKEISILKKKYLPEKPPLDVLIKKRDELEFIQMTRQLSKKEEEELVEELSKLEREIRKREKILEQHPILKEKMEKEQLLKMKGDKEHQKVKELAERAQNEHLEMIECFNKSRKLFREIKKIQKEYILNKLDADKAHKRLVSYIKEIRKIEEQIDELRRKEKAAKIKIERDVIQKKADEVYERFKKGEKLSTEDLMLLQKAGLI